MGRLLPVNVGFPRDISWRGETLHTSVWKDPVQGKRLVRRLNVDGDAQGDLAGHGGEHRAVLVYQIDSYLRAGELLFRATTGACSIVTSWSTWLVRPYVHPLNVADFKGIRAGWHFRLGQSDNDIYKG